jgi:hypothetical protein
MQPHKTTRLHLTDAAKEGLIAVACFAFFLLLYGFTSRADLQVSDEAATFATGISLATRGDLAIDDLRWLKDSAYIGQIGRGDHLYSRYFPGNSLAAALIYRLTARQNDGPFLWGNPEEGFHPLAASQVGARLALRLNALLGAFGVSMLLLLLRKYYSWRTALTTVLLFGLCTDWWYQSRGFFSEVGAGAFLMAGIYFADDEQPALCSLMLAVSLLFRPTNIVALPIWSYAAWKKGWRSVWSFALILGSLGCLAFYNWIRFQSPLDFGYGSEGFTGSLLVGLVGVLLSPGRSIFFYSPVTILAITGGRIVFRKDKPSGSPIDPSNAGAGSCDGQLQAVAFQRLRSLKIKFACLLVPLAGYILLVASWHNWDGGSSWGSRLLTPVLPILAVMLAPAIARLFSKPGTGIAATMILLAVIGLGIQVLTITRNPLLVLEDYVGRGYATYTESVISFHKNWLALQLKNLTQWKVCDLDAYSLRALIAACK